MPTERKTDANRRNAQLSTDPRTPKGRAALSRNAQNHGLASGRLVLPNGNREDFLHLLVGLPLRIPARQRDRRPRGPASSLRLREEVPVNRRGGRQILVERRVTIGDDSAAS